MHVIGIDPGLTGALSMIGHQGEFKHLADVPTMQRMVEAKKGRVMNQVNCAAAREILRDWLQDIDREAVHVVIELPIAFPGQNVGSVAASFLTAGHLEATVASLGLAHTLVRPAEWKKALKLTSSKEQCRASAIRRWPAAAPLLKRVMDHNRAESLLLALYGHERFN